MSEIYSFKGAARFKRVLPWRVKRRLERLQLQAMQFLPGLNELTLRSDAPAASLIAVGDIALCGIHGQTLEKGGNADLPAATRALLAGSDLRVGNLEAVLTNHDRLTGQIGSFLSAPVSAINYLRAADFNILSLANNHARDCGLAGLLECIEILRANGIQSCGAGATCEQSRTPAIVEVAGVRVGVLGYCDNFRVDIDATENVAPAALQDDWVISDISLLREQVDVVVLQLHWGWEFSVHPPKSHRDRSRRFVDAGADLVLCHHAHVPKGVEVWKKGIIAHGLGNFIFPPDEYLAAGHPWSDRSFALKVYFDRAGVTHAEIIPCSIDAAGFPRVATGQSAAEILGGLGRASRRLQDDSFLAWLDYDLVVRETISFFSALQTRAAFEAQQWALQLHSPFRAEAVQKLECDYGVEGARIAAFMRSFAVGYQDPGLLSSLWNSSREERFAADLQILKTRVAFDVDSPGRIP